jgi:hypothetical protein
MYSDNSKTVEKRAIAVSWLKSTTGVFDGQTRTFGRRRMIKNPSCCIFGLFILLALPTVGTPYQQRLILSMEAGTCSLRVEADDQSHTLRLRVHPERPDCGITKEAVQSVLKAAFSKTAPPKLEGTYSSLFIGRLIDFPWLSHYLATTAHRDKGWNRTSGKPLSVDINKYVAVVLSKKEVTAQVEETFGDTGYRIVSVSVEKVLVGRFRDVPLYEGEMLPGKVPYDCMVWFRLEKK